MPTLPAATMAVLASFAPPFSRRAWLHVQVLLAGAILAPARRTVAAALRVTGGDRRPPVHRSHRVPSRARWSGLAAGRVPLRLLAAAFAPDGPPVFGVDEPVERRRGKRIAATGIERGPVRSSRDFFVEASGRRWVCLMRLVPIPWAARTWAPPVLTALAPSARDDRERAPRPGARSNVSPTR